MKRNAFSDESGDAATGPSPRLVVIQRGYGTVPFFCVRAMSGDAVNLHETARRLGDDQTVYALHTPPLDEADPEFVEAFAARSIVLVRDAQPVGPYLLGGCFEAGAVAYAMARGLVSAGARVALLVLIDTLKPGADAPPPSWTAHLAGLLRPQSRPSSRSGVRRAVRAPGEDVVEPRAEGPYAGRSLLFRAAGTAGAHRQLGEAHGWTTLLSNLEVVDLPGDRGRLFSGQNLATASAHLRTVLRSAAR